MSINGVKKSVLITGGSGMIGQKLSSMLQERNYEVNILSRQSSDQNGIRYIHWDPSKGQLQLDEHAHFDYVIHLAGAGIADQRWTDKRKTVIVESRTATMDLLFERLKALKSPPTALISSSAVGYYGSVTTDHIFTENDASGTDFLARCCVLWEASAEPFLTLGTRLAYLRTGAVLSDTGGMLDKVCTPVKYFAGAPLGSGKQYVPWIHIDDLCAMYIHCLEHDCSGPYNAVAPQPVNQTELMQEIAHRLNRPLWLPNIPAWTLKMLFGEMSTIMLEGSRISARKIIEKEFHFTYPELTGALVSLDL